MGLTVTLTKDGRQFAEECQCQLAVKVNRKLRRAAIPERFQNKSLRDFSLDGKHSSIFAAHMQAQKFLDHYPYGIDGQGLLFVGSSGLGKTHLASAILRDLVVEKNVPGLFYDYSELLKQIQNSYNPAVAMTELGVLQPVFDAEVLVLDDLGSTRPSDWVWDTVSQILNMRYSRNRTTIITTNFANRPANWRPTVPTAGEKAEMEYVTREGTLGDRIGNRMLSRLHEMCVVVPMQGEDIRQGIKRARFSKF